MTATVSTPVIEVLGLQRTYPGPPPIEALRRVDLAIHPGEFVAVVGRSGSGKSTLLSVLGLMDTPTGGEYRFEGVDVTTLNRAEQAHLRGRLIGFVFQAFHLMPTRSVMENVALAGLYVGDGRRDREDRARVALGKVEMGHRLDARPPSLSGGERQRVAIARAIAAGPSLLLADEPTGNLDSGTSAEILRLFDQLHHDGTTIVMITHDPTVAARAERTVTMDDGVLQG